MGDGVRDRLPVGTARLLDGAVVRAATDPVRVRDRVRDRGRVTAEERLLGDARNRDATVG